ARSVVFEQLHDLLAAWRILRRAENDRVWLFLVVAFRIDDAELKAVALNGFDDAPRHGRFAACRSARHEDAIAVRLQRHGRVIVAVAKEHTLALGRSRVGEVRSDDVGNELGDAAAGSAPE